MNSTKSYGTLRRVVGSMSAVVVDSVVNFPALVTPVNAVTSFLVAPVIFALWVEVVSVVVEMVSVVVEVASVVAEVASVVVD